jgi:hypothetical protein
MASPLILNRYRLLETKGKGGFGTVDVAWDTRLQRRVAIKRIPLAIDETDLPGIQEARTAALLNDARIVSVLDFEVTGTEALIIMEHVDGPTLGMLMKESTELLDLDTIATIVGDVAAALEYAHENQVLHLDIKPDNILIDHKGHIKVTDFGLSELSGTAGFAEPQGGTIGYMPPEQLLQGDVDDRTDLWALAVLLYQLLTGKNPFVAPTTNLSFERILNDPLPLPSALCPELDPAIDQVLARALMANKLQRFPSVAAFIAEITPLLGNAQAGRRKLKYRVNERELNEVEYGNAWHQDDTPVEAEPDEPGEPDEPDVAAAVAAVPWDRLSARLQGVLGRLLAALACASVTLLGLSGFDLFSPTGTLAQSDLLTQPNLPIIVLVGIVALVALGGFLVPQLGSALACVALVVGVIARGFILIGIVLAVVLVAWWLLFGRRGHADATVVMLAPLLGALWMGFALPLLAGLFLPWRRATGAAVAQALILIALAALVGGTNGITHPGFPLPSPDEQVLASNTTVAAPTALPDLISPAALSFLARPTVWLTLATFALTALVVALLAARNTRPAAVLAAVLGTVILALGCVVAPPLTATLLTPSQLTVPALAGSYGLLSVLVTDGARLALSFILVLLLSLLGMPTKAMQVEEV